jgi:hypothetical protein
MCGYDKDKLYALDDLLRARDTVLVFPRPSLHPNWSSWSKRLHSIIIRNMHHKTLRGADERDPVAAKNELLRVFESYPITEEDSDKRWYMQVGLAGCTKWHTLGTYLFLRDTIQDDGCSPVGAYYSTALKRREISGGGQVGRFLLPERA